jgi:hypothetical protein
VQGSRTPRQKPSLLEAKIGGMLEGNHSSTERGVHSTATEPPDCTPHSRNIATKKALPLEEEK